MRNQIYKNRESGIYIYWNNIKSSLENNNIFDNEHYGVSIAWNSTPTLLSNKINSNGLAGISVDGTSGGTFKNNDLRNNRTGAWNLSNEARSRISSCLNNE